MIGTLGTLVRQVYEAAKRLPPPPNNQMCISTEEAFALEQTLAFLDKECGKSHQGYYSTHSGWAGGTLKKLLERYKAQTRPKRWYIRHKVTGLYLGSCHTTGDGIWGEKRYAESWSTRERAVKDGMAYHPFYRLRDSAVNIVEEPEGYAPLSF